MRSLIAMLFLLVAPICAQSHNNGLEMYHAVDCATSLSECRQMAEKGHATAQYKLGVMYDNGWGVAASDIEAVKWYSEAAEQGHTLAQHDLAFMYVAGTGVSQDYVRAYMWLNVAVASGNGLMTKHLDSVSRKLSFAQIEEAEKMAREWMENYP